MAWSFASLFLQFGAGLLVLPALLRFLAPEEVGVWYAYQLVTGLAMLLEFGYQATFTRNLTYAFNGLEDLRQEGAPGRKIVEQGGVNAELISALLDEMRSKYLMICGVMGAVLLTAGTAYIVAIARDNLSPSLVTAWLLYVGVTCTGFYVGRFVNVLSARNEVRTIQQIQIVGRILSVLCSVILLSRGFGLVGAVLGYAFGTLVGPMIAWSLVGRTTWYRERPKQDLRRKYEYLHALLWHNTRKSGQVAVGTFVVQRATSLIASGYLSLTDFASFSVALQMIQVLASLGRVKLGISMPSLIGLAGQGEIRSFRLLFLSAMRLSWLIYGLGVVIIVLFGNDVLSMLGSNVKLLDTAPMLMLAALYLLEITHGNCAWALTCFNTVPFVRATWITGIGITALSLAVAYWTTWGVTGFILVQLLCQAAYNAWKWPLELYRTCTKDRAAAAV